MSDAIIPRPPPERLIVSITSVEGDARMRRALIGMLDHPADIRREQRQAEALDEVAKWMAFHLKPCKWTISHDADADRWDSDCGQSHLFIVGGPTENSHAFCPYCGRTLEVA